MDIFDIRRSNLLKLLEGKNRQVCVERWDTSSSTISQILSEKTPKNLGEKLARKIETAEGLPKGFMDVIHGENVKNDHAEVIGSIEPWDDNTPLDPEEIELPLIKDIELSAGAGRIASAEIRTNAKIRFSKADLIKQGVNFSYAVCVPVSGNSMEPVIPNKATVGIDTSNTSIVDGKIYAVVIDNELARVKQLYRLPNNRVRLRSFNRDEYEDEEYSLEDIRVVGKLFWSSVMWD